MHYMQDSRSTVKGVIALFGFINLYRFETKIIGQQIFLTSAY
jgi:hypothetical protein